MCLVYCTSFAFLVGLVDLVISVAASISTDLCTMRWNNPSLALARLCYNSGQLSSLNMELTLAVCLQLLQTNRAALLCTASSLRMLSSVNGSQIDGQKVGHFLITIQKSFKLIINQLWT